MENRKVAIIGLGLLGASLGMALKGKGYERLGWTRRKEIRESQLALGVIDKTADRIEDLLKEADLTILCLPIPRIIEYCAKFAHCFKKGSIVTDVGSVKEIIVNSAEPALKKHGVQFIGSHPMAGTEKAGPEAAKKDLYDGAVVFITPTTDNQEFVICDLEQFWRSVNTRPIRTGLVEHDNMVAHTSHLSHISSLALTLTVLECKNDQKKWRQLASSSGFRDVTRITSSSPQMWREIIENNQSAVIDSIKGFEDRLRELRRIIEHEKYDLLQNEFTKGKTLREDWMKFKYGK
jgi:prephenate dehydrogenase